MPRKADSKLTDIAIKRMKCEAGGKAKLRDGGTGLFVEMQGASGAKKFKARHRDKEYTYGSYGAVTLSQARSIHSLVVAKRKDGHVIDRETIDDAREKVLGVIPSVKKKEGEMIDELCQLYMDDYVTRYDSEYSIHNAFSQTNKISNLLGSLHTGALSRKKIETCIDDIADSDGPAAAERFASRLSAVYNWAIDKGLTDTNPVPKTIKSKYKSGSKVSDTSLNTFRKLLLNPDGVDVKCIAFDIFKAIALCGVRRTAMVEAKVSEFDFKRKVWTIPPERTKTTREKKNVPNSGKPHEVMMSDLFAAHMKHCIDEHSRDGKVFRIGGAMYNIYITPYLRHYHDTFVTHDLRHTIDTQLAEHDVPQEVIDKIGNHVGNATQVQRTYNQSRKKRQYRMVMELWAEIVEQVLAMPEDDVMAIDECIDGREIAFRMEYSYIRRMNQYYDEIAGKIKKRESPLSISHSAPNP